MSMVSRHLEICLAGDWYCMVRILWSRSAILISTTRMSLDMAMNIFRRFSIWACSVLEKLARVSLVTPSTSSAVVLPKSRAISSWEASVSSMQSWRMAPSTASRSSPISATISATARGWMM